MPLDSEYFSHFEWPLLVPFNGFQVSTRKRWVNQYGAGTKHRGFPVDVPILKPIIGTVVDAKIGVAAGDVLGRPRY